MKGIIFNLLEDVVTSEHDADAWDDAVDDTGLDGAYSAVGSYPDEQFVALLTALPESTGATAGDRLVWFGERSMPMLASRYDEFFAGHTSVTTFLPTLNDIIHPEVRKLYPGADVPVFGFDHPDRRTIEITYRSHRRLCALARGFILGAARVFEEEVEVREDRCVLDGAESCLLVCTTDAGTG